MEEAQACCAGLAGICCGWDVAACPGACFGEAGKGGLPHTPALHNNPSGYCSWLQGDVSPCSQSRLLPREQPLDMRVLVWVSSYANELKGSTKLLYQTA